ncbi:MAG: chemotaxis protein CheW [Armatimonadota bacterium]|nr:chemotaxis protein CheW [bacterium]
MNSETNDVVVDDCEQLVVFGLADEYYGVDIGSVNTIIRMQEITAIPKVAQFVEGVINLRGTIIPVINLRKRFGLPMGELTKAARIVVVEAAGQMIGMTVDAVAETLRLPVDSIEPPSPVISSVDSDYLRGVGKQENRLVILLDLDKVLTAKEFEGIEKMTGRAKDEMEVAA